MRAPFLCRFLTPPLLSRRPRPALRCLVPLGLSLLLAPSVAQAQSFIIYGSTGTGLIYAINPVARTVSANPVFNTGFTGGINGIAWDQASERLYFAEGAQGTGGLYYWDRRTNTMSGQLLSATALLGETDSGSIHKGGYWYVNGAQGAGNDTLYRVDLTTLATTAFTNFDGTARTSYDFGDIAITANGTLYGHGNLVFGSGGDPGTFFKSSITANSSIPAGYSVSNYSESQLDVPNQQLALSLDEQTLYGTRNGVWYTNNLTTGAQTQLPNFTSTNGTSGTITFNDLSGNAALLPTPAPPGMVSGLIGIAMAGGQFGVMRYRKRRKGQQTDPEKMGGESSSANE
ncbi:MAG: hypothetical protein V4671_22895 [Armatimonadota bacterium]